MDYIYDIVLNFQDEYYEFYEWKDTDKMINFKKVCVYMVSNDDYFNLKYNDVVVDRKVFSKDNKTFLVTNGVEVMGILLDSDGRVIKRSSLLFDEADEVIEEKDSLKFISLKYKKNKKREYNSCGRLKQEKINYIDNYFRNIDKKKDEYLLKYIYYDIFNKEENDIDKIYLKLINLKESDIDLIYNSIKSVNVV